MSADPLLLDRPRPRNPAAVATKQAQLRDIKAFMLDYATRYPLRRLTGQRVQEAFAHLALSTVQGYMTQIHLQAEAEANSREKT